MCSPNLRDLPLLLTAVRAVHPYNTAELTMQMYITGDAFECDARIPDQKQACMLFSITAVQGQNKSTR